MAYEAIPSTPLVIPATSPGTAARTFLGAGACPAGSSPAGYGIPAAVAVRGGLPGGPATGAGPFVDYIRGDYTYDTNGNRVQTSTAAQLVQLALRTAYNSSSVDGLGLKSAGGTITTAKVQEIGDNHKSALAALVAAAIIRVVSVAVDRIGARVSVVVTWIDLATGDQKTTRVG